MVNLKVLTLALCGLFCLSLATPTVVSAQVVYGDTWSGSEANDDGTVTMYGYGEANGDAGGRIGVSVVILDPSHNQLVVQGANSRTGFVSVTTSISVSMSSANGDYTVEAAADYDFTHYDCYIKTFGLTSFSDNYYFNTEYTQAGVRWGSYIRCGPGNCQTVQIKRNHLNPTAGNFPPFANINVLRIDLGFNPQACFATSGIAIDSCLG